MALKCGRDAAAITRIMNGKEPQTKSFQARIDDLFHEIFTLNLWHVFNVGRLTENFPFFYHPHKKIKYIAPLEIAIDCTIKDGASLSSEDLEYEIAGTILNVMYKDDASKKDVHFFHVLKFARFFVRVFEEYCHREVAELQQKKHKIRNICRAKMLRQWRCK